MPDRIDPEDANSPKPTGNDSTTPTQLRVIEGGGDRLRARAELCARAARLLCREDRSPEVDEILRAIRALDEKPELRAVRSRGDQ